MRQLLILLTVLLALPAAAQDPNGIAISQSPEEGFHACHGSSADATLNCARQNCRSAGASECLRVRWCYPGGYAGAMTYLANREVTQVTFACGAQSEASLAAMLAALCAAETAMSECMLMVAWDPAGNESEPQRPLGKNSEELPEGASRPARAAPGSPDALR